MADSMKKVLDHGYVKFIGSMGTDQTIIEAARMSTAKGFLGWGALKECSKCGLVFNADQFVYGWSCKDGDHDSHDWQPKKGDEHLLEYLYKNDHMSPFEMCEMAIEVCAPIFVFREWHRHRTQSFNEFSARYAKMGNLHYVPEISRFEPKLTGNKQEDSEKWAIGSLGAKHAQEAVAEEQGSAFGTYEALLHAGVPKEVARINTPVSRYSKMRAKANLRNWLGFLKLRMAPNAQWEISSYAHAVSEIIRELWPRTYALFEEYTLNATNLSGSDLKALRSFLEGQSVPESIRMKLKM